jgi:hypothetical protein
MRKKIIFYTTIILFIVMITPGFAQELYRITSKEMGFPSLDYTVTEIKRTDRLSVLNIPGFHKRSAAASRWMICVYTDLAQKRGFEYWTVVYPEPPNEEVIVGFPNSLNEDIASTLGPKFGGKSVLPTVPVMKMIPFCKRMKEIQ